MSLYYQANGNLVCYKTPGCNVMTVALPCPSNSIAKDEAARLNLDQAKREEALQIERALCGYGRFHPLLGGKI